MRRLLILTLLLAFVLAGTTNAAVKQGDKEISLYGTYLNAEDSGILFFSAAVKLRDV